MDWTRHNMSSYQIVIKTSTGLEVKRLSRVNSLRAGRSDRAMMPCEITIPQILTPQDFSKDMIIEVWRNNMDGSITLDGQTGYFLRRWNFYRDSQGKDLISLYAIDGNYIIDGREVEYAAESTQATKSGVASDVIKAIMRENFVSATDTTRNLSASYFTVDADDGFGASVTKAFSRQMVLTTIQALVDQSRNAGTWITFDTVYNGTLPFTFKTFINQRGDDIRETITLSVEAKSLSNPLLSFNYVDEKTAAYVAGKGENEARLVGTATSTAINDTVWSRREAVTENFQVTTTTGLNNEARALLNKKKAKRTLTGQIAQTKGLRYGRDWNYGDRVLATYLGYTFDCRINGYEINYLSNGGETTDQVTAFIVGEESI